MINPPTYPQQQHQSTIYSAANAYYNAFPMVNAATAAAFTPGNRLDKTNAASGALVHGVIFQQTNNAYGKWVNKLYKTHPKLAEEMNQHPILIGGPIALAGFILSDALGIFGESLFLKALLHPKLQSRMKHLLYSTKGGRIVADGLRPAKRFLNKPLVMAGLAIGSLAFTATLLVTIFSDAFRSGKEYRAARKETPLSEADPYELNLIAQQRLVSEAPSASQSRSC